MVSFFPNGEESHVKAKLGGDGWDSNSSYFPYHLVPAALLLRHGLSLFTPEAAGSPGGAGSPQMAAPSSDGCREERPGHMSLQVAVEGGHGPEGVSWVPEPEFWSWAPTHMPC